MPAYCAALLAAWLLAGLAGCSARKTELQIIDYRPSPAGEGRAPDVYVETFDEAFYRIDDAGNVDIVLRREQPGLDDPARLFVQIVHVRSLWRSIPGRTVAHRTQINATVSYLILSGAVGASFEGAGSVFYDPGDEGDVLTGELERAYLTPQRRLNGGRALFTRAELSGQFRATYDPRRVVRVLNDMDRLFGPPPF